MMVCQSSSTNTSLVLNAIAAGGPAGQGGSFDSSNRRMAPEKPEPSRMTQQSMERLRIKNEQREFGWSDESNTHQTRIKSFTFELKEKLKRDCRLADPKVQGIYTAIDLFKVIDTFAPDMKKLSPSVTKLCLLEKLFSCLTKFDPKRPSMKGQHMPLDIAHAIDKQAMACLASITKQRSSQQEGVMDIVEAVEESFDVDHFKEFQNNGFYQHLVLKSGKAAKSAKYGKEHSGEAMDLNPSSTGGGSGLLWKKEVHEESGEEKFTKVVSGQLEKVGKSQWAERKVAEAGKQGEDLHPADRKGPMAIDSTGKHVQGEHIFALYLRYLYDDGSRSSLFSFFFLSIPFSFFIPAFVCGLICSFVENKL